MGEELVKYSPKQAAELEKSLDISENSGIIEDKEIERVRKEIIPNLKTDAVVPRQSIHRQGTKEYTDRQISMQNSNKYGPSYITITDDEILELVNKYKGTGQIKLTNSGKWNNQEIIIDNDNIVGCVVNDITGKTVETSVFKIHYGNNGIHIVPDYPSKKRK